MFAKVTRLNRIAYGEITGIYPAAGVLFCGSRGGRSNRIDFHVLPPHEKRRHKTYKSASAFLLTFRTWTLLNHKEELKLMLVLFFGAGISFIFLCGQSKALNVDEQSLSAFFVF